MPVSGRLHDVKFKLMTRPGGRVLIEAIPGRAYVTRFSFRPRSLAGKSAVTVNFAVPLAKREAVQ